MDRKRIIIALDYADSATTVDLLALLDPAYCRVKIGKELFTRCGPDFVRKVIAMGFDVFLDLKFHDIPNTVAKAVSAAADMGVWMVNVHASGGRDMMNAARAAVEASDNRPLLIAVTVLTSMSQADLAETGINVAPIVQVSRLATLAHECRMDGVVCSAEESSSLRASFGKDFLLVTPGIRPAGDDVARSAAFELGVEGGVVFLGRGRREFDGDVRVLGLEGRDDLVLPDLRVVIAPALDRQRASLSRTGKCERCDGPEQQCLQSFGQHVGSSR